MRTKFLGKQFVSNSKDEVLKSLVSQVSGRAKTQIVFTPNPEQLVYAKSHSEFDKTLGIADILLPDGIGIIYGAKFLSLFNKSQQTTETSKTSFVERISGVDVVSGLLYNFQKTTAKKKPIILIIGGRGYENCTFGAYEVKQVTAQTLDSVQKKAKHSTLFWHEAFLNVTQQSTEEKKDIAVVLKKLKPQVVFVALGAPYQEEWIIENKALLESSEVRLVMVVGGTFDMLLGKVNRAPKWMQKIGLEWLFRLYQEPWRWRRQLKLLQFMKLVVQEALK